MAEKNRKVVYTCITGGYDNVPVHKYVAPDWDYVLFTDNQELIKQGNFAHWVVKPLRFKKLTNVKNARWHKVNAHKLFPSYVCSLWLDGQIMVNNNNLFTLCDRLLKENVLCATPAHPRRKCIYEEAKIIKEYNIDFPEVVDAEMCFLKQNGYPKNYGLSETNIVFRQHNKIKSTLHLWWRMIKNYSKRDQLSFNYSVWKTKTPLSYIYTDENSGFGIHHFIEDITFIENKTHDQNKINKLQYEWIHCIKPYMSKIKIYLKYLKLSYEQRIIFKHRHYVYKHKNYIVPQQKQFPKVLCYTYANEKYFPFAILYPLFILNSAQDVAVEIAIDNYDKFIQKYSYLVEYYNKTYPGQVFYHPLKKKFTCTPGSIRFITQPLWYSKYVYIGDVDIMITQDIATTHIKNIIKNDLDYSNIKRKGRSALSGLHFIEYDKMYPIRIPKRVNLKIVQDETLLYILMKERGYKIPDENIHTFRPLLGIHFSFWSRPPLPTLTTKDKIVIEYPSWFNNTTNNINEESFLNVVRYLQIRYSEPIVAFTNMINPMHIELRKIIQYMDISCEYFVKNRV